MESKEVYQKKIETQLKKWKSRIDGLKTKVESAETGAKAKLHQQLEGLHDKRVKAEKLLEEVKSSGQEKWENVRVGIEDAWTMLSRTTKKTILKAREVTQRNKHEEVSRIAYEIWQQEGCPDGRHAEHWLRAETIWRERHGLVLSEEPAPVKTRRPRQKIEVPPKAEDQ